MTDNSSDNNNNSNNSNKKNSNFGNKKDFSNSMIHKLNNGLFCLIRISTTS